jgi:uncharacterized membrane protein
VIAGSALYLDTTTTPNRYTSHGFITTGSNTQIFDPPGSFYTTISGINSSGTIVGEAVLLTSPGSDIGYDHAFVYQNGQVTYFSVPGSFYTEFDGINDEGEIIGTFGVLDNPGAHIFDEQIYTNYGFIYDSSNGTYQLLDDPLGTNTYLTGIDDAGDIIGSFSDIPEPSTLGLFFAGVCFAGGIIGRNMVAAGTAVAHCPMHRPRWRF